MGSPERRFDSLASPDMKETSDSHRNRLFENELISELNTKDPRRVSPKYQVLCFPICGPQRCKTEFLLHVFRNFQAALRSASGRLLKMRVA